MRKRIIKTKIVASTTPRTANILFLLHKGEPKKTVSKRAWEPMGFPTLFGALEAIARVS